MIVTEWDRCQAALVKNNTDDNTSQLVRLTDVKNIRTWDYSKPTLTRSRRFTSRKTYGRDQDDFFETIKQHNNGFTYALLDKIGVFNQETDIVLYGGSLLDIILGRENQICDWDLRLVGARYIDNEKACVDRAKEFVEIIFNFLTEENAKIQALNELREKTGRTRDDELFQRSQVQTSGRFFREKTGTNGFDELFQKSQVQTSRQHSTVTIKIPSRNCVSKRLTPIYLQFTFLPYINVQHLLSNCDPHCCRIAIQDGTVWLDKASKYCIESLCIVATIDDHKQFRVDSENEEESKHIVPTIRHALTFGSSMKRFIKYFDKGFDIILPDLDMSKVPRRNLQFGENEVLDLPHLTVVYSQVVDNKIMVNRLEIPKSKEGKFDAVHLGYGDDSSLDINVGESIHHNIRCLVNNVYDRFHYVAEGESYQHIFDYVPQLTHRMIDKSYETVQESLSSGSIPINTVLGYFNATHPSDVIEELVVIPIRKNYKQAEGSAAFTNRFELFEEKLHDIISKEKKMLEDKLKTIHETMESSGRNLDHLIKTFHPDLNISTEDVVIKELYGSYYLSP